VEDSENQHTRIWGNMPLERFERIANNLQEPLPAEHAVTIDGTDITKEYIAQRLGL
jgi:hypothetical protein